jgi:hypothetical protein
MGEPQQIPVPPPPQGKKSNCLLIGCVAVAAGAVLFVAVVGGLSYFGLRSIAEQYTEAEPRQLPITTISEEDYQALSARYQEFIDAARDNQPTIIRLTADDINALIRNHPDFREARGHVFVTIDDDVVGGQVSFQIPDEFPMVGGRYLNGSATFQLEMSGGRPVLYIDTFEVAGRTPPPEFLDQFRQENLLKELQQDPQSAQVLNRVDAVQVSGGVLEISTR